MYFQDNHMNSHSDEASIITLLTMARDWIKKAARRNQEEQSAMALAKEEAKRTGEVRPELSKMDYDLLLKEFVVIAPMLQSQYVQKLRQHLFCLLLFLLHLANYLAYDL